EGGGVGGQVAGDDASLGGDLLGQALEAVGSAGDQHEVVAASGELARELFANSRGCAGDEGCFRHELTLFSLGRWKRLHQSARRSTPGRWRIAFAPGRRSTSGIWRRRRIRRSVASRRTTARCARRFSATGIGSCTRRRSGG